jgi:methyl-accepting chemotaxis protein
MEKKERYRVFWFNFNNNSEDNKEFIRALDFEYIMFYEAKDTKIISGYIRFKNQRLQKSVESKTFLNKATVNHEKRSEKKIKTYYSQMYKIYEYGTPTKQGARNDIINIPKLLNKTDEQIAKTDEQIAKTDKEIAKIVEQIAKTDEQIAKTDEQIAKKDEEIAKKDEEINKIIQSFQDYNNSNSEKIKQLTEICLTLEKNNNINNESCKNAFDLIIFIKGIQFEIQDFLYNIKFDHVDVVKRIFNRAYEKLDSEMSSGHCA